MGCRKTIFLNNNSRIFHQKEKTNKQKTATANKLYFSGKIQTKTKHRKSKYQQDLNDIENYKTEGTIINSTKS